MIEPPFDGEALRLERLARVQAAMGAHDVDVCLLLHEPNIRYATGASAMPVYAMSTFVRCAVVPQVGTSVLFEHPNSMHRSALRAPDVRPMHAWEFFDDPRREADTWAEETLAAIREVGGTGDVVTVDRLGVPAHLALTSLGATIRDAAPVTQEARRVKTPQEIVLLDVNAAMVMEMLGAFESAVAPGMSERELLSVLSDVMIRGGGEYLATNTVSGGPNTNPWRAEATDRRLEPGELVFVDTDTVGIEGMFFWCLADLPGGGGASIAPPSGAGAARDVSSGARVAPGDGGADPSRPDLRRARLDRTRDPRAIRRATIRVHGPRYRFGR